jgi:hypothetical protein
LFSPAGSPIPAQPGHLAQPDQTLAPPIPPVVFLQPPPPLPFQKAIGSLLILLPFPTPTPAPPSSFDLVPTRAPLAPSHRRPAAARPAPPRPPLRQPPGILLRAPPCYCDPAPPPRARRPSLLLPWPLPRLPSRRLAARRPSPSTSAQSRRRRPSQRRPRREPPSPDPSARVPLLPATAAAASTSRASATPKGRASIFVDQVRHKDVPGASSPVLGVYRQHSADAMTRAAPSIPTAVSRGSCCLCPCSGVVLLFLHMHVCVLLLVRVRRRPRRVHRLRAPSATRACLAPSCASFIAKIFEPSRWTRINPLLTKVHRRQFEFATDTRSRNSSSPSWIRRSRSRRIFFLFEPEDIGDLRHFTSFRRSFSDVRRETPTLSQHYFINVPYNLLHQSYILHRIVYLVGSGK